MGDYSLEVQPERLRTVEHVRENPSDRRFRYAALVTGLILWGAITPLAAELVEYSRNTLDRNGTWISSKFLMQVHLMGAEHFLSTRNALSRNRLNLGEWYGFNEVHVARPVRVSAMELRFRLDPDAYLDVILDRRESGRHGIRLSRWDRFPTEWYRAERTGRIIERTAAPVSLGEGWHQLSLSFAPDGVTASVDGDRPVAAPFRIDGERFVGLGAGLAPVTVDLVRLTGRDGHILLEETFRNRKDYGWVLAGVASVALIAFLPGAFRVLLRGTRPLMRLDAYRWLTALLVTLVVLVSAFAFDYAFWSRRYVYGDYPGRFLPDRSRPLPLANLVESLRSGLFGTRTIATRLHSVRPPATLRRSISAWDGSNPVPENVTVRFRDRSAFAADFLTDEELRASGERHAGTVRVALLGTSQTWGVGAETIPDTLAARVHARLAEALGDVPLETYDFAVPGSNSSELLRRYQESWGRVGPDLLVVNLSNNESDNDAFVVNLRALAAQIRASGGRIAFVLEANSAERPARELRWLVRKHALVTALGAELEVPVWDLHGYLTSDAVIDSGRLWWDHVHLSSWGQSLAGEWLAARINPLLSGPGLLAGSAGGPGSSSLTSSTPALRR